MTRKDDREREGKAITLVPGATAGSPRVALRPPLLLLLLLLLSLLGGAATAQPVSREESRELRDEASSLLSAK